MEPLSPMLNKIRRTEDGMNRLSCYFLLLIGILGLLDSILVSIYVGTDTGTLFPGAAGVVILVYLYIRLHIRKGKPVISRLAARKAAAALLVFVILVFTAVEMLIISGAASDKEVKTEHVIILGGGLKGDQVTPVLRERLLKGLEYLRKYPEADVIVTGGLGFGERITEAEAMEDFLISHGITPERIIREDRATSTMENFLYTRDLLQKSGETHMGSVTVVTSDFHMQRSKLLARRVGFEPYGIASYTPRTVRLNCYVREFFAMIKSFFFDRV